MSALTVSALGVLYQFFDRRRQAVRKPAPAPFLPATIFLSVLCFVVVPTVDGLGGCDTTVFGFEKYVKTSNGGVSFQDSFSLAQPASSYTLIVFNGSQGENRISRGSISINGVELAAASDFSQQVDSFEKPIGALQADNTIDVVLQRGDIGSFIVVRIVDRGSSPTALSGVVLNTQDQPLKGVAMTIGRISGITDIAGQFFLDNLPCGPQRLGINASGVKGKKKFASVSERIELAEGQVNQLTRPIFLPEIDLASGSLVPSQVTSDIVISNPNLPSGISLRILAGTEVFFPDGSDNGVVTITEVPVDRTPANLPEGFAPLTVLTVQPEGVVLSQPAVVQYPNADGYPPGSKVDLFSLSPGSGGFVKAGTATVSADGQFLTADAGAGVFAFDWHLWLPLPPDPDDRDRDKEQCECERSVGSEAGLFDGPLTSRHELPAYRSLNVSRGAILNYNSLHANPHPILEVDSTITALSAAPSQLSFEFSVNGAPLTNASFVDISGLDNSVDQPTRQAVVFDASSLPTGVHTYSVEVTNHYSSTQASRTVRGEFIVNNQSESPLGAGWAVDGLQRLLVLNNGDALLLEGDGTSAIFRRFGAGPQLDLAWVTREPLPAVAVSFGDAGGGFAPPVLFELEASVNSRHLEGADFNGDGFEDLLTFSEPTSTLEPLNAPGRMLMLLGNGDGTFQPPVASARTFRTTLQPGVQKADFNGDGVLDAITGDDPTAPEPEEFAVLLGNGDGSFRNRTRFVPQGSNVFSSAADYNQDSIADFIVRTGISASLRMFLGNGDGTFQDPLLLDIGCVGPLVSADVNDDGREDLVTTNIVSIVPFIQRDVCVALNSGGGAFSQAVIYTVGSDIRGLALADVDADGDLDVVASDRSANTLIVLPGNGDGSFQAAVVSPAPDSGSIQSQDFTGDGLPDILIQRIGSPSSLLSIMSGNGDGTFSPFTQVTVDVDSSFALVVGNFNGDFRSAGFLSPRGDFTTLTENPNGSFTRLLKDGTEIRFDSSGRHVATVDRNGNTTTYNYNADETLASIVDPVGLTTAFEYVSGKLSKITDPAGRETLFTIDGAGDLVQVSNPDASVISYEYGDAQFPHFMTARTDARGNRTDYSYSFAARFQQSSSSSAAGPVVRAAAPARAAGLIDPSSGTGTSQNPAAAVLQDQAFATFTDPNSNATQYRFDENGEVVAVTDPLGRTTVFERDENGNTIQVIRPDGSVLSFSYDLRGNLTSSTNQGINATTSVSYDPNFSQPTSIVDPNGHITTVSYDASGNPVEMTEPTGQTFQATYDAQGLLTSVTDPLGNITSFSYDGIGNLSSITDPLGNATSFTYDSAGNGASLIDPDGREVFYTHDVMNQLTQVLGGNGGDLGYGFDANGNLMSVTDSRGNSTTFAYDAQDRLVSSADPAGAALTLAYDAEGNIVSRTNRNGQTIIFAFDAADQLIARTLPGNQTTIYTHDLLGNMTVVEDPNSKLTISYDAASRPTSVSTQGSPHQPAVVLDYGYDLKDGVLTMTNSLTGTASYAYDPAGRLTQLTDPAGQTFEFSYNAVGKRAETHFPNGVTAVLSYDPANRLSAIVNQAASGTISSFSYGYDASGNRTNAAISRQFANIAGNLSYGYDSLVRLTAATHPLQGLPQETFAYDAVGNRLRRDGEVIDDLFDAANRLIEDADFLYAYDLNGNLISKQDKLTSEVTQFSYDALDRLIAVNRTGLSASYLYDALGRRIVKEVNGQITRYVYDNEDILLEFDAANQFAAEYIHSLNVDEPLAMRRSGNTFYYHSDGLDSITEITDAQGQVVQAYVYDSFGSIVGSLAPLNSFANPYAYAGRELDLETGLYFLRARYFDSAKGRFLSEDPIGFANRYPYVGNNPATFTDPYGLQRGNPEYCRRLLQRINNLIKEIQKRTGELDENPLDLPEACPGDRFKPSLSKQGHRMLLNMKKAELARRQAEYLAFCGPNPPFGVPPKERGFFDWEYWEEVTGLAGTALLVYLIISEGSRLFPPRNLVPVP